MLRFAIILVLAAFELNPADANAAAVDGPAKPIATVPTTYTCTVESGTPTAYTWDISKVDTTTVAGTDKTQSVTLKDGATGDITCSATVTTKLDSPALTVTSVKATPEISQDVGVSKTLQKGGAYTLTCSSAAQAEYSTGATWKWAKGSETVADATSNKLEIKSASDSDKGDYTCTVTLQYAKGVSASDKTPSATSDKFTVVVDDVLGVYCKEKATCEALEKTNSDKFTGACDTKTNRCVCKGNAKAEGCEASGTPTLIASVSMTLMVAMAMILL